MVKEPPAHAGDTRDLDLFHGSGRPPEGASGNVLQSWKTPWTEESGRLQSMGSQMHNVHKNQFNMRIFGCCWEVG